MELKDEKKEDSAQKKRSKLFAVLDLFVTLLIVFGISVGIRTWIMSPFHVFGPSMCSTINDYEGRCEDGYGDYLIVNELVYLDIFGFSFAEPKAGEIIVFRPPTDKDQYLVKRIIGVPGDTIRVENGRVYKLIEDNFEEIDESEYLNEDNLNKTYTASGMTAMDFEVPEGHYFVLGDNRNRSTDSRQCFASSYYDLVCEESQNDAFVPEENIRGRAALIYFPFKNIRFLKTANYES